MSPILASTLAAGGGPGGAEIIGIVVAVLVVLFALVSGVKSSFTVEQQDRAIVERWGRFRRVAGPGLCFKIPFVDVVRSRVDLQIRQVTVEMETKTQDNVFVHLRMAIQYNVDKDRVFDAYYQLEDPVPQMEAFAFDVVRAHIPGLTLDEAYEDIESIAQAIKNSLADNMGKYGYNIVKALITSIEPDAKVKVAMNEINAARREQEAAKARGEAEKTLAVKRAEAEAESKRLQGEGIANQRRAIIQGLRDSVDILRGPTDVDVGEAMRLVTLTQFTDTMAAIAQASRTTTLMVPYTPGGMGDIEKQIRDATTQAQLLGRSVPENGEVPAPRSVRRSGGGSPEQ
jgi:regulator of protease activity HflC (stomatin/prohibitin superfamily)